MGLVLESTSFYAEAGGQVRFFHNFLVFFIGPVVLVISGGPAVFASQ